MQFVPKHNYKGLPITVVGGMMKQTNHKFAFVWELNKWSMEKVVVGGH